MKRIRAHLVACFAVVGLVLAALTAGAAPASAQCAVTAAGAVSCSASTTTTATTNTNGATVLSSDQYQVWDNGTPITGSTNGSITVDGYGLVLQETGAASATIGMANNIGSTIESQNGNAALTLAGNGGKITYTGDGSIIGDSGPGISASNIGTGQISITTAGTISAGGSTAAGQDGIDTQAETGATTIDLSNGTIQGVSIDGLEGSTGISSTSLSGNITITANNIAPADYALTGINASITGSGAGTVKITTLGTINTLGDAVDASNANVGGVIINANAATIINAGADGEYARVTGTGGGITITNAAESSITASSSGIDAQITGAASSGNVIVHAYGDVTADAADGATGIIAATDGTGFVQVDGSGDVAGGSGAAQGAVIYGSPAVSGNVGIFANQDGTSGGITISGTGKTSGNDAILAVIDNSASVSNILINRSGAITVTGDSGWGIAAETFGTGGVTIQNTGVIASGDDSSTFTGILAQSGGGNVLLTNVGAVTADSTTLYSYGIYAATSGIGTVIISGTSTVTSTGDAINASTTGTGDVSVTGTGAIVGDSGDLGTGYGIYASSGGGKITVTPGSTVSGAVGISAATSGTGMVLVTANSTVTGTDGDAVFASAEDGTINVTANAAVTSTAGGDGVDTLTTGLGAITVTGAATITGAVDGISAQETGAGPGDNITGILITGSGKTFATSGNGISAVISDATNASNILINRSGTVTVDADGGDGIYAVTAGTGDVTVTSVGNVQAGTGPNAIGIDAESEGGNVLVTPPGSVSGGNGINASTILDGTVTVTTASGAAGNVTGVDGYGVNTSAEDGATVITNKAQQISGTTWASDSASTGEGTIKVTGTGNYVGGTLGGIGATASGIGPGDNVTGIWITGSGNTSATTGVGISAEITNASNDSDILIDRSGTVTVDADGGDGIYAVTAGTGDVTVTGVGDVLAGTGSSAIGIDAESEGGNVLVTPPGSVSGGNGINASTILDGTVTVTTASGAAGNVTGVDGYGVNTSAEDGATVITNKAQQISGTTWASDSASTGEGTIKVTGTGNYVGGTLGGIGATASGIGPGDNVTGIWITGSGNTSATTGVGISAEITNASNDSDILIDRSGTVTVDADGGDGIDAVTAGTGDVTVTGIGNVVAGTGASAIGIDAESEGGDVLVTPPGSVSGGNGINASTILDGTVTVTTASGAAGNVTGVDGYGVNTSAEDGATLITNNAVQISGTTWASDSTSTGKGIIEVAGTGDYIGGTLGGIGATASGIGPGNNITGIWITGSGNTSATSGVGISAEITNASNASDIVIDRSGSVTVDADGGDGIDAVTAGTGDVTVTGVGDVLAGTDGSIIGILASSKGGSISVIPTGTVTGGGVGISANTTLGGTITVTTTGDVTGGTSDGILTSAVNGVTKIAVNDGTVTGNGSGNAGIKASASGTGNLGVTIAEGATVTGGTTAGGVKLVQSGTGSNTVDNSGTILGAGSPANPVIAIATTDSGSTLVTNTGTGIIESTNATANNRPADVAVYSTVATGDNTIANSGLLVGEISLSSGTNVVENTTTGVWDVRDNSTTGFDAAAFGAGGANTLTNAGIINAGNAGAAATSTFTGIQTIINGGTINAGLSGSGDVTTFTAAPPGTVAQTVTNTGTINANGLLNFEGDATFNNAGGIVDMRMAGHAATDVTALNTSAGTGANSNTYTPGAAYNFVGGTGSRLGVDAYVGELSSSGATVLSDRLLISGTATSTTGVLVNDTNGAGGSYNPVGITVVGVNGASSNAFVLQGLTGSSSDLLQPDRGPMGAIKKGFWYYPLLQSTHAEAVADGLSGPNSSEYRLYGLPDAEAYQLPLAVTGAQNIWYETVLGWSDRQQDARRAWNGTFHAASGDASEDPAVWFKITGSWGDRTVRNEAPSFIAAADVLPLVDTSFKQGTYSIQAGADYKPGHLFTANDAVVVGGAIGYVSSDLAFKNSPNTFNYSGATVGAYADYLNGGFFLDALVKADLLSVDLNLASLAPFGYTSQDHSADTWGVMSDIGYHFNLSRNSNVPPLGHWYIEPLLTIAYTRTSLDNFAALGTSAIFDSGETLRGAAGASIGGPILHRGEKAVNFSITGKYWDEFNNDTQVVLYSLGPDLPLTDVREKGYGEVFGTIDFTNLDVGWSGFLNGGAKWNSEFTTTELKGGLRYSW